MVRLPRQNVDRRLSRLDEDPFTQGTVIMHFGAHWGNWGTAVVAFIVGALLIWHAWRKKRWNWAAAGGLSLLLAAAMFVNGWRIWPQQTAEHFIAIVYHGKHDDVRAMLSEPGQWTVSDDGGVAILAEDNSKFTLTEEESRLVASSGLENAPVPRPSWSDSFAAKRDFQMASTTARAVTLYCSAEQGKVRIRRVEIIER